MSLIITSSAFREGERISDKYTCKGLNISPPLSWSGVPDGTISQALICEDPDAPSGLWVHWVLVNLPASVTELPEGVPTVKTLDNGAVQGLNDSRKVGYSGPCPPPGTPHRYYFKIYALDTDLNMKGDITRNKLFMAMEGHILAQGEIMGIFSR